MRTEINKYIQLYVILVYKHRDRKLCCQARMTNCAWICFLCQPNLFITFLRPALHDFRFLFQGFLSMI